MGKKIPPIEALGTMSLLELKELWLRLYGATAPSLSADLLRRGLAYRLQEKKQGGLDKRTVTYLSRYGRDDGSAKPKPVLSPKLSIGTKLVRDWHGVGHSVTVLEDGFEYDGQNWKSLTAIAHHITGTKWSGPRFFGLMAQNPAS